MAGRWARAIDGVDTGHHFAGGEGASLAEIGRDLLARETEKPFMHGVAGDLGVLPFVPPMRQFLFVDHEFGVGKQQRLGFGIEQSASMIRTHIGQQYRTYILGVDPGHRQVLMLLIGGVEQISPRSGINDHDGLAGRPDHKGIYRGAPTGQRTKGLAQQPFSVAALDVDQHFEIAAEIAIADHAHHHVADAAVVDAWDLRSANFSVGERGGGISPWGPS